MSPAARALRASCVSVVLGLTGTSTPPALGGPKWSERPEPLPSGYEIADHRHRQSLRLVAFGDSGSGSVDQIRVGRAMAEECTARGGCDLALMAGDNIYRTGVRDVADPQFEQKFETPYAPLGRLDMWAVPGNHDWAGRGSVTSEVRYTLRSPRWRMPSHDYPLPLLPDWLSVYGLDTTRLLRGPDDGQLARAHEALCTAAVGWKLLVGHHPVLSSGPHAGRNGVYSVLRDRLTPLIQACGVHVYVAGHDHHQEHLSAPAFEQLVQGAGGAELRPVLAIRERPDGVRSLFAESRYGFAIIEATPRALEIRFVGVGRDGSRELLHCRVLDRAGFADRQERSRPCS